MPDSPPPTPSDPFDDRREAYDYELPPERIAAYPTERRDGSRLLVHQRLEGLTRHVHFRDLGTFLEPGDLLVLNDTKVLPARLEARRASGARVEVLVQPHLERSPDPSAGRWSGEALLQPSRRIKQGEELQLAGGVTLRVEDPPGAELRRVSCQTPWSVLAAQGQLPLPPYLPRAEGRDDEALDRERYQTVYARHPGAIAAPTAGLHFTEELLEELRSAGVGVARLTLHVSAGTFLPVRTDHLSEHVMHDERFVLEADAVEQIQEARRRGRRVVAVGTTTTRTLEAVAARGPLRPLHGATNLMIRPPYHFRCIDALLTNFHLPGSTLLALVSAFAGRARVLSLYGEAIEKGYRFYSYGDAMLLL